MAFWVDGISSVRSSDFNKTFCTDPHAYNYFYGAGWNYTNYSCTELPREISFWKEGPDTMYIPLSYHESTWQSIDVPINGTCDSVSQFCLGGDWITIRQHGKHMCECRTSANF